MYLGGEALIVLLDVLSALPFGPLFSRKPGCHNGLEEMDKGAMEGTEDDCDCSTLAEPAIGGEFERCPVPPRRRRTPFIEETKQSTRPASESESTFPGHTSSLLGQSRSSTFFIVCRFGKQL